MMDINEVIKQLPFWKNLLDEEKISQPKKGVRLRCFISEAGNVAILFSLHYNNKCDNKGISAACERRPFTYAQCLCGAGIIRSCAVFAV